MKNNAYYKKRNTQFDIFEEYKKVSYLCKDYGYECNLSFDRIHIVTNCEAWYFIPQENGIIKLYHGNSLGRYQNGYHKQFVRKITYEELLIYIKEHGDFKYKGIITNKNTKKIS